MDIINSKIEDFSGADPEASHLAKDSTDAWYYEKNLPSQRAWEYQDQYVVYFAWKKSPTCNFKVATKSIYHAEQTYAMYVSYDSPTIIWRNGQILKMWGDKK